MQQHESAKWIVLGLTALGGVSAAFWIFYDRANESSMTALNDGLFLEYQIGDNEDALCNLSFKQQGDAFQVTAEPEECDVAPRSLKTNSAVTRVDSKAHPIDAHQVVWGWSKVLWIAPDKHTPSQVFEGQGFIIRAIKPWKDWNTAMVEQKLLGGALTRRFYFDTQTGFLVGLEEEDLEGAREVYMLVNTNAKPPA